MKRISMIAALVACLAAGSISAAQAAKTTDSTLSVKYKEADSDDPYGASEFKGTVGPKKCAKGRTVKLKGSGTEVTNRKGKFKFTLSGPAFPGKYKFKVVAEEVGDVSCSKVRETLTVAKSG